LNDLDKLIAATKSKGFLTIWFVRGRSYRKTAPLKEAGNENNPKTGGCRWFYPELSNQALNESFPRSVLSKEMIFLKKKVRMVRAVLKGSYNKW
jgi:hypothetical protein